MRFRRSYFHIMKAVPIGRPPDLSGEEIWLRSVAGNATQFC